MLELKTARSSAALALILLAPLSALAQPAGQSLRLSSWGEAGVPPLRLSSWGEAGVSAHHLSAGQPDWSGVYFRGMLRSGPADVWNGEIASLRRFGDSGTIAALGNTHQWNADWFSTVAAATSENGKLFLPRLRLDAFLSRRWLPERRLVTTVGYGYYRAKDVHRDHSWFLGASYYFAAPFILEGGVRFNRSDPGSVNALSQYVAITHGRDKERYLSLRYGWGHEAYQSIGANNVLSDFSSRALTFTWRQWLSREWGFNVRTEAYRNPYYHRDGVDVGVFREF